MRVVIVGGGIGGMATALALADRGHEVRVLESEQTAGGKVGTLRLGPWQVETGPFAILQRASTEPWLRRLKLESSVVKADAAAKHRFIVKDRQLAAVPTSPPALLTSKALSWRAKLAILREPFLPRGKSEDETVAAFARRRLGLEIAENFVCPFVTGVFAGDYEQLSLRSAFPTLAQLEREHGSLLRGLYAQQKERQRRGELPPDLISFAGGMGDLTHALATELGDRLTVAAAVSSIAKNGNCFVVIANGARFEADRVVLALPAQAASLLLRSLDENMASAFSEIPAVDVAAISLGYSGAGSAVPSGFGFLVPRCEPFSMLGTLFVSGTFPQPSLPDALHLRVLVGGSKDPEALSLSDQALVGRAESELASILGRLPPRTFVHVQRWRGAIAQYTVGHHRRMELIEERGRGLQLYSTGASLRGVGVNDVLADATAIAAKFQ